MDLELERIALEHPRVPPFFPPTVSDAKNSYGLMQPHAALCDSRKSSAALCSSVTFYVETSWRSFGQHLCLLGAFWAFRGAGSKNCMDQLQDATQRHGELHRRTARWNAEELPKCNCTYCLQNCCWAVDFARSTRACLRRDVIMVCIYI